jgi:hypothetical protein
MIGMIILPGCRKRTCQQKKMEQITKERIENNS